MAGKQVNFEVNVDGSDAISEFKKVGKAAEQAGKAIEKGLEVTPDVSKIDKFIGNLKEAKDEAENVAKAVQSIKKFAPEVDDSEIAGMVLALRKAGVEFDALDAKADELGTTLRSLDSPKVKELDTNMRTASVGSDQLTRSVGGSRSVLANMVGNATQDLGALTGVAGSAGVAIGQMGEYMADARLEGEGMGSVLRNFVKIAGPVLGISVAVGIATKVWGDYKRRQQEIAAQTEATSDALIDQTGIVENLADALTAQADVGDFGDKLLLSLNEADEGFIEVLASANKLGISFEDLGDIIAGLGEAGDLEGFNMLVESIQANMGLTHDNAVAVAEAVAEAGDNWGLLRNILINTTDLSLSQIDALEDQIMLYGRIGAAAEDTRINDVAAEYLTTLEATTDGLKQVADARDRLAARGIIDPSNIEVATEVNRATTTISRGLDDINAALDTQASKLRTQDALWHAVIADLTDEDGIIGTADGAAEAYNQLQTELGLSNEEMDELAQQKVAEALEEQAAEALRLQQALADLNDTIASIDTDDLSNIGSAIGEALDVGGVAVNLQVEEAQVRGQVDEITTDIQTFVDEHGAINWAVVLDPAASAQGFDAGLAQMIGNLQDQFQTGIVNAFESGGTDAAVAFIAEFGPKLAALGLSPAQVKEFMGIPADGSIPLFLQLQIDAEAKADALAILNSIAGVDPNNPAIAYLQLQVQTGAIDPVIAEITALLLAQKYGVDVTPQLAEFTPEQIAAAQAQLAGTPVTLPTEADTTGAEGDIGGVTDAPHPTTIDADADTAEAARLLLAETSKPRTAHILTEAHTLEAGAELDAVANPGGGDRIAHVSVVIDNLFAAISALNDMVEPRTAHIHVVQHAHGGGAAAGPTAAGQSAPLAAGPLAMGVEGGGVGVATLAAPTPTVLSPTPLRVEVINQNPPATPNVTVRAGVIGNRHELDRIIAKGLRSYARLNGTRN